MKNRKHILRIADMFRIARGEGFKDPREPELRVGDIARLNSGGPRMMVVEVDDQDCLVLSWRDERGTHEATFPRACVHRLSPL